MLCCNIPVICVKGGPERLSGGLAFGIILVVRLSWVAAVSPNPFQPILTIATCLPDQVDVLLRLQAEICSTCFFLARPHGGYYALCKQ